MSTGVPSGGPRPGDDPVVDGLRQQITRVDRELLAGINHRLEIVRRLHDHKRASGLPLRDPDREASLLADLLAANTGPLSERGVTDFVAHLLDLTRQELHGA